MKKLSVVLLNWNGKDFLEKFLPALVKNTQGDDFEIVVADNNSTDESVSFVQKNYPGVRIVVLDKNYGYAGGYNKALKQLESEYFVLINSDVEVSEGWFEPVLKYMEEQPEVAVAMPKVLSYDHKDSFEYAGASGGFIDQYGFPFCRGRILYNIEKDTGQYDTPMEIFWASGACMFIRSSVFFEAGLLDDDFFAHMEEIDLCWRVKRLGYKVVVVPESVVYHVGGGTLPNNNPRKLYLNYRNSLYLLQKNLPKRRFLPVLIMRMILDGASALVYLSKFSFKYFWAVVRAHSRFYMDLHKTHQKRIRFLEKEKVRRVGQIYPGSMVFSFIVQRKKVFDSYFKRMS